MKKEKALKETAKERKERLRDKWTDRLWMICVSSFTIPSVATARTCVVSQDMNSFHSVTRPGTVRLAIPAYRNWVLLDTAAAFFEKHQKVKYLVVTVATNDASKKSLERAVITGWLE